MAVSVSFRVKLLASHAVVAVAVSAATLLVVERSVSQRMEADIDERLEAQAHAVSRWLERAGHPDRLAGRLAGVVGARVTIIDPHGIAVGESHDEPDSPVGMDSEGQPEEVRVARAGGVGRETRFSAIDGEHVRYVAVRAPGDSVVRLGLPIGQIDETRSQLRGQLAAGALAALGVALALAVLVAGPLTRRLREATAVARRIGAGDYDVEVPPAAGDEVGVLSQTLAAAAGELRDTESRRREFLANVAHEIRTPVTSIQGYAETLQDPSMPAETRGEFLHTIHRNAMRIGSLVEDLLELESLQAGKGRSLEREPVALAPVVHDVVETLRARAAEVGGEVITEVGQDAIARGDADAIERILLNLVDNALRHGGRGVTVAITARRAGARVTVEVRDDGRGIPAEDRGRIFERFHRGRAARDPERRGSGLGLAIARELAHAMGGSITLADRDGGASFTVELPA